MAKKQPTREDFKNVESVVPTPEDRELGYFLLSAIINRQENETEAKDEIERRAFITFLELVSEEGYDIDKVLETWEARQEAKGEEGRRADKRQENEEYFSNFKEIAKDKALGFLNSREETLRSAFCKEYLSPMVLAGMRGGWLIGAWWRAVDYGFSVIPSNWDEVEDKSQTEYHAFPYRSVDEMTEDDRRAFLWAVEDVYYSVEWVSLSWLINQKMKLAEEDERLRLEFWTLEPYKKEGYGAEEIARRHSSEDYTFTPEEVGDYWEYETELYLPIIINRLDEARYYALKYKGTEYLDYIKSLNVEEDFDYERDEKYNEVMEEGYVWHSDK